MKKKISFENINGIDLNKNGLSAIQVTKQRNLFGINEIVDIAGTPWLDLIFDTLKDPMIWFLLGIGIVFITVGDTQEAIVLFIAIIPLLFMDAILHWRTSASTTALKGQLSPTAKLIRNGKECIVDVKDIVPGDLVLVASGEYIPADGIFENAQDLQIDESILTGEAFSVLKLSCVKFLDFVKQKENILIEQECLGFAGTRVLTGSGYLRVLSTGRETYYGEIIQSVANLPQERTPLQKSISRLVRILIFSAGVFCILLAVVRVYQGYGWLDAILSAATLAVAAIPEEFPVVFTFFLGVGVYRLAKKHAFVRRAVSVENIGRITQICTDKTGTITIGQLKLTHIDPVSKSDNDVLYVAGNASDPSGADPVDQAILDVVQAKSLKTLTRIQVFPFTEDRRRESAFATTPEGRHLCFMKGSPEIILSKSDLTKEECQYWLTKTHQWAREGHKVLACSSREISVTELNQKLEPETGFKFSGLMAFEDPARPEVAKAIKYCYQNSIGVLMITGDHPETAMAIARDVGLGKTEPLVVSAEAEPEKFTKEFLKSNPDFLQKLDIVARCNPLQKLEIVNGLRTAGELVAVTGDGVNDVPALKAADIGIAMGERGTRSAKEVSSIVLANDNFETIVNAIIEGRQLFINLKTSFEYLLLIHIPFVLTAAFIPLLGYPLLYLPVHIVWLELIIHPTALFAFQKQASDKDINKELKKPLGHSDRKDARFFSRAEVLWFFLTGLVVSLLISYGFISSSAANLEINYARSKAMALLILWSAGIVAVSIDLKNRGAIIIFGATILSAVVLIQSPIFAQILHVAPLQLSDWVSSFILVLCLLIIFKLGRLYIQKT